MNTNSEIDRIVSTWLECRVVDPPSGSLERALALAGDVPQKRHRWLPARLGRGAGVGGAGRRGARGAAVAPEERRPLPERRNQIGLGATIAASSVAVLALVATLVLPRASVETEPPPAIAGNTYSVAADGSGQFSTISEAVAAAQDGATILIQPGVYDEAFVIDKDITLAGNGATPTDVVITVPIDAPLAVVPLAPYRSRHGRFELPGRPAVGIQVIESAATLRNLQVTGHRDAIDLLVVGGAPTLEGLLLNHQGSIEPNASLAGGLFVEGGSSATVRDSSIWYRSRVSGGSDPTFTGTTFQRAQLTVQDGSAPTFADGTISGDCGDDTVTVVGGSYPVLRGNQFINAELDVRGGSAEATGATESTRAADATGPTGATIEDNRFSFSNLVAVSIADDAIATVSGNQFTGNTQAVNVSHATATIRDNTFVNNMNAMTLSVAAGEVSGNTVRGGDYGVSVVSAGAPSITGNTIENATARGILVGGGTSPSITGNSICGSAINLFVQSNATPTVGANEVCPDGAPATGQTEHFPPSAGAAG